MLVRNLSIRTNLALLILSTSALAVVLASFGFGIYERRNYSKSAVSELTALADTLGANTAASLAFDDRKTAQEMLGALATEPHVMQASLYDNDGRTFAEFRRGDGQNGFVPLGPRRDGAYFDSKSLTLYRGVLLNGQRTGSIAIAFDLSDLRSRLLEYIGIAFVVLLLSVLVTFLASLRLAVYIGAPLVHLAAVASRVSVEKDYSIRAKLEAGGESGLLICSFNEMLSQIESRELALNDALKSLRISEERYALAARGANDGLWDWDLISDEIYFSPRWDKMLGFAVNGVWSIPEEWFRQIHADDRDRLRARIAAHCQGTTSEFVSEYRMRHESGDYVWMLSRGIAIRDSDGKAVRMAGSQTDITEGKISDPLTHIPNRLYFIDRLQAAIEASREKGTLFAVLFLDLDEFKLVNDSLGHSAGDELLVDVAGRLKACIRTSPRGGGKSVVARVGGDEFAILLNHIQSEAEPATVSARIIERLSEPFFLDGRRMFVSASVGIALSSTGDTPEDLLRNSDTAMYQAKANGKARAEYFNEEMRQRIISRIETASGLRKAIDNEQLVLHYQPIVSLSEDRICGFEALVRWNHPERGLIYPGDFIPVAEESDLIISLGSWVLREACRQMAEWHRLFPSDPALTINVNVSSRQFSDSRLVDEVELALSESGLNPETLQLELTEGSLIERAEQTLATLDRLKSLKVRLEIDDFGTGYSSLSYLQRLPFDTLKIDRSFIGEMKMGNDSSDIVKAIVEMANSLRLRVIAEGIETQEQLSQVRQLGCNFVQGFLFSKAIGANAAMDIYKKSREYGVALAGVQDLVK
jgi:diguanylate cyclase (GGDEF)-like protein/PAS domain S-box-containing protein